MIFLVVLGKKWETTNISMSYIGFLKRKLLISIFYIVMNSVVCGSKDRQIFKCFRHLNIQTGAIMFISVGQKN